MKDLPPPSPKKGEGPIDPASVDFPEFGGEPEIEEGLDKGTPAVSTTPGKTLVIVIGLLGIAGFILISLLTKDKPSKDLITPENALTETRKPIKAEPDPLPPVPPAPVIPPPPAPLPPPPLPPEPSKANESVEDIWTNPNSSELLARRQSESVVFNSKGGLFGGGKTDPKDKKPPSNLNDPNQQFAYNAYRDSEAVKAEATHVGNLYQTIAQGKMIDVVLETAINTDLPGTLRAIVSQDVYAEAGQDILMPKGSRLIGTYNTGVQRGQNRVFIVWTRAIRPDGVDIQIGSEGTDPLGRSGVAGQVDNKFFEVFSSAILSSIITFGIASAVEGQTDTASSSRRTFNDGSTEDTISPTMLAGQEAVTTIGDTGRTFIEEYFKLSPTITIDQGTRMKVFVNRDLIFPERVTRANMVIP